MADKQHLKILRDSRRQFLIASLKASGQLVIANGIVYSASLIARKNGNTAGAK